MGEYYTIIYNGLRHTRRTYGLVLPMVMSRNIKTKEKIMQPHQQRVVEEKIELDKKAKSLSNFIGENPVFDTLDPAEQERLKEQNDVMWQYSEILGERLSAVDICPVCYEDGMETLDGVYGCGGCGHVPGAE